MKSINIIGKISGFSDETAIGFLSAAAESQSKLLAENTHFLMKFGNFQHESR